MHEFTNFPTRDLDANYQTCVRCLKGTWFTSEHPDSCLKALPPVYPACLVKALKPHMKSHDGNIGKCYKSCNVLLGRGYASLKHDQCMQQAKTKSRPEPPAVSNKCLNSKSPECRLEMKKRFKYLAKVVEKTYKCQSVPKATKSSSMIFSFASLMRRNQFNDFL